MRFLVVGAMVALLMLLSGSAAKAEDVVWAAIPCETWMSMDLPCPPHQQPYRVFMPIVSQ